jgi:predicted transcriptional regulator
MLTQHIGTSTIALEAAVVMDYNEGMTISNITKRHNISNYTMYGILKENNVSLRRRSMVLNTTNPKQESKVSSSNSISVKDTLLQFRSTKELNDIQNMYISDAEAQALLNIVSNISTGKYTEKEILSFVGGLENE